MFEVFGDELHFIPSPLPSSEHNNTRNSQIITTMPIGKKKKRRSKDILKLGAIKDDRIKNA